MVWLNWQHQKFKHLLNPPALSLRQPFYILTITLLNLLLPLSFLLLSRFSNARYYLLSLEVDSFPSSQLSSFLSSFLPSVLYLLVSIISTTTLVHSLTGKVTITSESLKPVLRPRLYIAWPFICTLQVCIGLGIEGSIAAGINDCSSSTVGMERSLLSRLIFFLGLHETMLHWSRVVVRPVVDDTFFGVATEERWAEMAAMAASFGTLWWWKLRNEVESLVAVAEFKGSEVADFVAWGLYYLTVTIGMIKIVKGFMWLGMLLLCRRAGIRGSSPDSSTGDEDKV
ncbi:hypothetical protein I3843_08G086400 [Carya illinoinensis]|uniref:Transmembrane protein n=1 Tax=Carya illinoinensis TaxID=32201 RepID=A0A8T1PU69_CARIL|nr:uncharacterized protein LOC122274199 [Carya illinoinensis]KAG2693328.1 hypothetical protein I3760_08G090700 [Carya illinoinensis]KAG6644971.1 hypothetical protein CIPAW_08G089200 [Carya illinoinensis]KAG6700014.1 hypothetical protein I3842_08G089900 [Carya illinoinensis]KAG7967190.1 hypothetical protein I3843_08G086400 [Carya illinoinensis]